MAVAAMAGSILPGWAIEAGRYRPWRWARASCWAVADTDSGGQLSWLSGAGAAGTAGSSVIGASRLGQDEQVGVDARARRVFARAGGGVLAGEGAQLRSVDGGVEEDDVLGVDESGCACARHGVAQVRDLSRCGPAGDDGEDPAGPQYPLARRVQRCRARGCAAGRQGGGADGDRERGLAGRAA